ncbi:putative GTP-binding protein EngB [bioreactor metagenome]|uniref:Putative GTP-binding protein EngB n=1 Tax=bioreactor metagenome TaxID=1076179 RepID=A0A645FBQ7_9ZZZZ
MGKSSLLNKLFNRKSLARVSSVPGKTITINFYTVGDVKFVDLPGYGYAKVSFSEKERWSKMLEGYFNSDRNIKFVVQLVDMRHKVTEDDLDMMRFLTHYGYPFAVIMTKSDKLNKTQYQTRMSEIGEELKAFKDVPIIPFSSLKGEGVEQLKEIIEQSMD